MLWFCFSACFLSFSTSLCLWIFSSFLALMAAILASNCLSFSSLLISELIFAYQFNKIKLKLKLCKTLTIETNSSQRTKHKNSIVNNQITLMSSKWLVQCLKNTFQKLSKLIIFSRKQNFSFFFLSAEIMLCGGS